MNTWSIEQKERRRLSNIFNGLHFLNQMILIKWKENGSRNLKKQELRLNKSWISAPWSPSFSIFGIKISNTNNHFVSVKLSYIRSRRRLAYIFWIRFFLIKYWLPCYEKESIMTNSFPIMLISKSERNTKERINWFLQVDSRNYVTNSHISYELKNLIKYQ